MPKKERKTLSNALLKAGLLTEQQLESTQKEERKTGKPLREILIKQGLVTEEAIANALSSQLNIPYIDLTYYYIDPAVIPSIPEEVARRHQVIPLFKLDAALTIAVADPFNIFAIEEVEKVSQCQVNLIISTPTAITNAIAYCDGS